MFSIFLFLSDGKFRDILYNEFQLYVLAKKVAGPVQPKAVGRYFILDTYGFHQ